MTSPNCLERIGEVIRLSDVNGWLFTFEAKTRELFRHF